MKIEFAEIVDLSQVIGPDLQMFPAYPQPQFTPWTTREAHGFLAESLFFVSHTGTHVDAPWHFESNGAKLDALPLKRFIAPGHVLDVRRLASRGRIDANDLRSARRRLRTSIRSGDAILLRTGWERTRGRAAYLNRNPGLSQSGAAQLVDWKVGLVGIDTANIDRAGANRYPAHHTLLKAQIPVIENVVNLAVLGSRVLTVIALPLPLAGTSGSPIRLVALVR